ncbi:MAG: response regulator [bacterium]|nr:response regulator [bacterium]
MLNFLIVFAVTMGVTHLTLPLAKLLGRRMNAWDTPDGLSQDKHVYQVVRTGGIAIASGVYAGILAALFLMPEIFANRSMAAGMVGGGVVFVTGLLDDLHEIKPWLKASLLAAACLTSVIMMSAVSLTGYERLDFLLAVLILMGGTNAFNLMDGMDGLASGMAIAASLGFLALSLQLGSVYGCTLKLIVGGAALGFLFFNRFPAKIFMGDSGSLLLGFYLTGIGLQTAGLGPRSFIPVLLVLSPFILDTGLAIVRRMLNNMDIFTGDRRHVYDLLHARIPSVWRVDWLMWGLGLLFSALGWAAIFLNPWMQAALLAVSWLALIWAMIRLGMFEPAEDHRLTPPAGLFPEGIRILVVDDDPGILQLVAGFLKLTKKGYQIFTAADGFEAGRMLSQHDPQLVILDLKLPGMDGFEVCRYIKEHHPRTRVLAITGRDNQKTRQKIMKAGADAFMGKPFRLDKLLEECDRLLNMAPA